MVEVALMMKRYELISLSCRCVVSNRVNIGKDSERMTLNFQAVVRHFFFFRFGSMTI